MRHHGRNGRLYADVSTGATGAAITELPFIAEWSIDESTDRAEVTAMGDGNKVKLPGFGDFKGSASGFDDESTDLIRTICDGKPRLFMLCDDLDATKSKYWHGLVTFDGSHSGGASKAVSNSITFEAAGTITQVHSATAPDPTEEAEEPEEPEIPEG